MECLESWSCIEYHDTMTQIAANWSQMITRSYSDLIFRFPSLPQYLPDTDYIGCEEILIQAHGSMVKIQDWGGFISFSLQLRKYIMVRGGKGTPSECVKSWSPEWMPIFNIGMAKSRDKAADPWKMDSPLPFRLVQVQLFSNNWLISVYKN